MVKARSSLPGNAGAGIVYASDAQTSGRVRVVGAAPRGSHEPVVYPIAVMQAAKEPDLACKFLEFLSSESSRAIFRG